MRKIRWSDSDNRAVLGVARCGYFTEENFKSIGLTDRRIKTLSSGNMKIFERVGRDINTGHNMYKLTPVGQEKAHELGVHKDLQYFNNNIGKNYDFRHDRELANQYCSLSRECQDRWKTEQEYVREIKEIREHIRSTDAERWEEIKDIKYSSFDGGYIDDRGQEHYIEIVTASYSQDRIDSKFQSESLLGGTCEMTRV